MTFGSLFAGIGGIDLGFARAGWECRWQIEIDPFCRSILAARFPGVKLYEDITKTPTAALEDVDAIVGGFPCQDLSQAGKRAGITGSRSGLWSQFARVIGDLRPRIVVIENVPGLLVRDGGSGIAAMSVVVGELARLGYVGCWRSLRAAEFGAFHLRKRVFIIGKLANPSSDIRGRKHFGLSGSALPAGISAAGPRRGEDVEDARLTELGRAQESECLDRQRPSDDGGRAGGELADTAVRGRRVSGEPSGSHGLTDGLNTAMADPGNGLFPQPGRGSERRDGFGSAGSNVSDAEEQGLSNPYFTAIQSTWRGLEGGGPEQLRRTSEVMADPNGIGRGFSRTTSRPAFRDVIVDGCHLAFAPGPSDARWNRILTGHPDLAPAIDKASKPAVRGLADGIPSDLDRALENRTKRLRALGNAVVPQIAQWIAERINQVR